MSMHHRNHAHLAPKLGLRDLEEIREIVAECLAGLVEEITAEQADPLPEYLTTREVEQLTKYKKSTLEAFVPR